MLELNAESLANHSFGNLGQQVPVFVLDPFGRELAACGDGKNVLRQSERLGMREPNTEGLLRK
jgi:hypothetical protein